jgi:hypothetical protein
LAQDLFHESTCVKFYENRKFSNNVDWLVCHVFPLVPKLQLGNALPGKLQLPLLMGIEAGASAQLCSQAGAWEQEAKDLHPIHNIFMLRCDPHGVMGVIQESSVQELVS